MIIWAKKIDYRSRLVRINDRMVLAGDSTQPPVTILWQEVPVFLYVYGVYKGSIKPNPTVWGSFELCLTLGKFGLSLEVRI